MERGMHIENENEDAPRVEASQKNPPVVHRRDVVGRFLDGEDYIMNNPPGFAISVAMEWMKENGQR